MAPTPGEAGEAAPNINLMEINKQISDQWKTLSPAQRKAITVEMIRRIEEQRECKKLMGHSVPLNSFHDARSMIQSIETQVGYLTFAKLHILKFCSWRSYIPGLALNSCWWPVGLL